MIPRAPRSRHATRLLDRLLGQVEPDEGDQPPARALGERERAVVRRTEAGMPVRLVQAEHERAGDAVALHARSIELVEAARQPVDVVAEMDVRVDRCRRPSGSSPAKLVLVEREQLLGPLERVLHGAESMRAVAD